MPDIRIYTISIAGIFASIIYFILIDCLNGKKDQNQEFIKLKDDILKADDTKLDGILKDYEVSNKEIERRENITLLVGSILITASFLILASVGLGSVNRFANLKFISAIASIGLYLSWLFILHYTTKRVDNISYSRLRAMEEALTKKLGYNFGIHSYLFQKTNKKWWMRYIRRFFWGYISIIVSISWLLLSISIYF